MKNNIAYDDEKLKVAIKRLEAITKELKEIAFELDGLVSLEPPVNRRCQYPTYTQEP